MEKRFSFSWKRESSAILYFMAGVLAITALVGWFAFGVAFPYVWAYFIFGGAILLLASNGVIGLVALVVRRGLLIHAARVGIACLLLLGVAIPGARFEEWLWNYHVTMEKAYPAQVGSRLEAYRQAHGVYADNLSLIPGLPSMPSDMTYRADAEGYYFSMPDLDFLFPDTYYYSSKFHDWYTDD